MAREAQLASTMVELADSLVEDFDVVDLLTLLADRCVELLEVAAAGLMLADPDGELRVLASSSEAMRVLELFEIQAREGPCLDCFALGVPVAEVDLERPGGRWPRFGPEALAAGFRSVQAVPLRLRGRVIGALNLFHAGAGGLDAADLASAQALADVATIAILQHRATLEAEALRAQLSSALDSRVVIEQAKGVLAERAGVGVEEAFTQLRRFARNHNRRLADVARDVVDGVLPTARLSASAG